MKQIKLKTLISISTMLVFLIISLTTDDLVLSKLSASFAVILGAYSTKELLNLNYDEFEQS